jgi:hypothetical protein
MSFSFRLSEDKKYVCVNDVIEALSSVKKKAADKAFERLDADLKDLCRIRVFPGDKYGTKAASLAVIIDIIKKIGCKASKDKKKNIIDFLIKLMGKYTDSDDCLMKPHNEKKPKDNLEEEKLNIADKAIIEIKDENLHKTSCKRKSVKKSICKEKEVLEQQHLQRMLDMEYNLQEKKVKVEEDRLQMQKDLYTHDFHLYTKTQECESEHKRKMLHLELEQRMKLNEENLKMARLQSITHIYQSVNDVQIQNLLKKELYSCLRKE